MDKITVYTKDESGEPMLVVPILDKWCTIFYYDAGHKFNDEIHAWNVENGIMVKIYKYPGNQNWFVRFESEEDIMAFKLRWL